VAEEWDAMSMSLPKNRSKACIVFVIDSLVVGGAESQMVMLAGNLHNRGYHCEVFVLRAEGAFFETLKSFGIPVTNGKFAEGRDRIALLLGVWRLWRYIYKRRPCVVHTYLPLSNFIGSIVGRLAGASVVITSRRGLGKHQNMESRWRYFDRISNVLSNTISVNSKAVANDTFRRDGVDRNKIVCIYNGLNLSRFNLPANTRELMRSKLGLSQSDFAWVKVANLVDYKGHIDLIQAFAGFSKSFSARLFLVGRDRGAQSGIELMVSKLGIADRIVFLGDRSDVPEILSAMDGYVMASHTEGFSNAILEAMAARIPIVATNVGGNAEALQDGELGILVEPHNHIALARAMQQIMDNQELRQRFAFAAEQTVREKYRVEAMVDSYLVLYRNGLGI
jgi:glycosyltransferase involved in cell wall biosynthesis